MTWSCNDVESLGVEELLAYRDQTDLSNSLVTTYTFSVFINHTNEVAMCSFKRAESGLLEERFHSPCNSLFHYIVILTFEWIHNTRLKSLLSIHLIFVVLLVVMVEQWPPNLLWRLSTFWSAAIMLCLDLFISQFTALFLSHVKPVPPAFLTADVS